MYCNALHTEIYLLVLKKTVFASLKSTSMYIIRTTLILYGKMTLHCVNNSINTWRDGITSVKSDFIYMYEYDDGLKDYQY